MGQVPASHPSLVPGFQPDENANCPGQSSAAGARARVLLGTDRNLVPYRILPYRILPYSIRPYTIPYSIRPYTIRPYTIRFLDRILRYGTVRYTAVSLGRIRYGTAVT